MRVVVIPILVAVSGLLAQSTRQPNVFLLSCRAIPADTSAADLAIRFGASNITDGQVYLGEGEYQAGTILFETVPDQRAEIIWTDVGARRTPKFVRIRGEASRWRTPEGLTLGQDLRFVERLNRRPFRLRGFGWDYGGTTTSWAGGVLAQAEPPRCTIWARFWNSEDHFTQEELPLVRQVNGEGEFSSGHPGMQAAHAYIHDVGLSWRE